MTPLTILKSGLLDAISKKKAWTPEALVAAGLPPERVRTMIVSGRDIPQERAFEAVGGRKRTQPTLHYVWGPDIRFHLGLDGKRK